MTKALVALLFLALNLYTYYFLATDEVIPERVLFTAFPEEVDPWRCMERQTIDEETMANLGATDYLACNYVDEASERLVSLYVGYHETQVRKEGGGAGENSIHPPEHCLPGSGWNVVEATVVPLDVPGLPTGYQPVGDAKRFIIAKGRARSLVYFWYQSRGRVLARNHEVIIYRFLDRATRSRTDGSLVRITIPIIRDDLEGAEATFRDFTESIVPLLAPHIPS